MSIALDSTSPAPMTAPPAPAPTSGVNSLSDVRVLANRVRDWMRDNVMGRDDVIELVLVALFGDGHVLLEDYPGSGKTTLANALGRSLVDDAPHRGGDTMPEFRRVQFTPDLLPSDVTGTMVVDMETNGFHFRRGPIFTHILLVDEINRTTPKVQSALLEAMAEKQVTVDNTSHKLDPLFFVIATQNPLDAVGTYPLPLAQLDRFLFKIKMEHIDRDAELEVLRTWGQPRDPTDLPRVARSELLAARRLLRTTVFVAPAVQEALVDIARTLRADKRVLQGVSTRSLVLAIPALQTLAMLRGRDFVAPEDIEHLVVPIFRHRMELVPGVEDVGVVIKDCIKKPMDTLARSTLRGMK
ncbi:MAG: AAA family ATPase [Deltaproteobacteria bacterium]|nr:AAA family ATPase [Deltaproteobacteria bacterium]